MITVNVNVVLSLAQALQEQLDRIEKAVVELLPTAKELIELKEKLKGSEGALRAAISAATPKGGE